MSEDLFRKLQRRLDKYSVGFPATESGVELEILRELFSEEDARVFLAMSPKLEAPAEAAQRLGLGEAEAAAKLEDMAQRGLLFRRAAGGQAKYGAIPYVHGLFEFQVKRLSPKLAGLMERYFDEGMGKAMSDGSGGYFLRPVPVGRSVPVEHKVASYDDAVALLRQAKLIVVTDCICRKQRELTDGACGKPVEVCFMFGSMAQYYLDHDMGRQVDAAEAAKILADAQEAGLVTQPATTQNPAGMCSCCGDCCGVLRSLNQHPKPASIVFSNHYAQVDAEACTGCETCLDRCQMAAISLGDDDVAVVDLDRCIGCGLCVTTCPAEAMSLTAKADDQRRLPPATSAEQMMNMAQWRGVLG